MWRDLLRLTRPPTLAASLVPVAVGTAAGALRQRPSFALAALMLLVAILLQTATNMANEYFDYRRGLDDRHSLGIAGVIVEGRMEARTVARLTILTYALALLLGGYLAVVRGWLLLALGFLSIAAGVVYSAGRRPIASTPFGEMVVFLLMGPLEVLVSEVAAVGALTLAALLASLPVGLVVSAILLANNLRDLEPDQRHGRRTLAILLGRTAGGGLLRLLTLAAYLLPALFVLFRLLPAPTLLALASLPAFLPIWLGRMPRNPVPAVAKAHLALGLLLAVGLFLAGPAHLQTGREGRAASAFSVTVTKSSSGRKSSTSRPASGPT